MHSCIYTYINICQFRAEYTRASTPPTTLTPPPLIPTLSTLPSAPAPTPPFILNSHTYTRTHLIQILEARLVAKEQRILVCHLSLARSFLLMHAYTHIHIRMHPCIHTLEHPWLFSELLGHLCAIYHQHTPHYSYMHTRMHIHPWWRTQLLGPVCAICHQHAPYSYMLIYTYTYTCMHAYMRNSIVTCAVTAIHA